MLNKIIGSVFIILGAFYFIDSLNFFSSPTDDDLLSCCCSFLFFSVAGAFFEESGSDIVFEKSRDISSAAKKAWANRRKNEENKKKSPAALRIQQLKAIREQIAYEKAKKIPDKKRSAAAKKGWATRRKNEEVNEEALNARIARYSAEYRVKSSEPKPSKMDYWERERLAEKERKEAREREYSRRKCRVCRRYPCNCQHSLHSDV